MSTKHLASSFSTSKKTVETIITKTTTQEITSAEIEFKNETKRTNLTFIKLTNDMNYTF